MQTKEQEHTEDQIPIYRWINAILFVLAILLMCSAEAKLIRILWFDSRPFSDVLLKYMGPAYVSLPLLLAFAMRFKIRKMTTSKHITVRAANMLVLFLGLLMMITYIALSQLTDIAIR
jgi:uncharacterized membrane protein YkvI